MYVVRKERNQYILDAGAVHGITKGATFDIYSSRDNVATEAPLATLIASDPPEAFSTVLKGPEFSIDKQAFALQTKAGDEEDLLVYVALDPLLENVFRAVAEEIKGSKSGQQRIRIVEKETVDQAHFDITFDNSKIVFNILNPEVTRWGLKRIPFQINPTIEDIRPVLRAAAHYNWHLRRTGNTQALQDKVKIEFTTLTEDLTKLDDDLNPVIKPNGSNLIQEGVIDLIVDDETIYGMKITNTCGRDLYASVFFFDNSDLSISMYAPSQMNRD